MAYEIFRGDKETALAISGWYGVNTHRELSEEDGKFVFVSTIAVSSFFPFYSSARLGGEAGYQIFRRGAMDFPELFEEYKNDEGDTARSFFGGGGRDDHFEEFLARLEAEKFESESKIGFEKAKRRI